jgi:5-methylcytosine-specific restriction enzyme A
MTRRRVHALEVNGTYGHWYNLGRWRKRSKAQLRAEPLCRMCAARGIVTVATVADHIEPHQGDWNSFLIGELQSLCVPCHDQGKRTIERRGFDPFATDADGWPLDPRHPANRTQRVKGLRRAPKGAVEPHRAASKRWPFQ